MTMMIDPVAPTTDDVETAKESSRKLAPFAGKKNPTIQVQIASAGKAPETVDLPTSALTLLVKILTEMGKGNAVTLMPIHAQLTTQQAAELLGVSRPFIVKELKEKKLSYQMVGTHRRIQYIDLLAYKDKIRADHDAAMNELVEQAQEHGMGY
jgi:excisionase family DNA binding protein